MVAKRLNKKSGQATIETALALPLLIWLLYYTLNAFHFVHTAHIGQKYAAMNLYERLANRAKFVIDAQAGEQFEREFMAVQYTDAEGDEPRRNILDSGNQTVIQTTVGICREPGCQ